jgi:hypothetical protein
VVETAEALIVANAASENANSRLKIALAAREKAANDAKKSPEALESLKAAESRDQNNQKIQASIAAHNELLNKLAAAKQTAITAYDEAEKAAAAVTAAQDAAKAAKDAQSEIVDRNLKIVASAVLKEEERAKLAAEKKIADDKAAAQKIEDNLARNKKLQDDYDEAKKNQADKWSVINSVTGQFCGKHKERERADRRVEQCLKKLTEEEKKRQAAE